MGLVSCNSSGPMLYTLEIMLTRRKVRCWGVHAGIGIGIVGVLMYLFSPFLLLATSGSLREFEIGRGAVRFGWFGRPRTEWALVSGAAPLALDQRGNPISPGSGMRWREVGGQYFPVVREPRAREWSIGRPPADAAWRWQPALRSPEQPTPSATGAFIIPAWIFVVIGAWCLYLRLPRDSRPGFCPKCQFDLRAAPPLPAQKGEPPRIRCPECGTLSPKATEPPQ